MEKIHLVTESFSRKWSGIEAGAGNGYQKKGLIDLLKRIVVEVHKSWVAGRGRRRRRKEKRRGRSVAGGRCRPTGVGSPLLSSIFVGARGHEKRGCRWRARINQTGVKINCKTLASRVPLPLLPLSIPAAPLPAALPAAFVRYP